jgi:hypothetical protein
MEQYIPKSVVLAEIERIKSILGNPFCLNDTAKASWVARKDVCEDLLSFIDSTEVKEVDLKKEIDDFMAKEWEGIEEEDEPFYSMIKNDLTSVAKHFFELGMAVSNEAQKGE